MSTFPWAAPFAVAVAATVILHEGSEAPGEVRGSATPPAAEAPAPAPVSAASASVSFLAPLPGLSEEELARFKAGRAAFENDETAATGLGPIFNGPPGVAAVSCASCHSVGGTGGGSGIFEQRFGRGRGEGFDPLARLGGSLLQRSALDGVQPEVVPPEADVTALRRTTPLFGLGLVDAVPDETIQQLALLQRTRTPGTAGRASLSTDRATGQTAVARFGWKAQIQSLREFAGAAYLNEMGVTSPHFPLENCPNAPPGTCDDGVPDPDDDGDDVERFRDFMAFLAPPPRGEVTPAATRGEAVFATIGCADCHEPVLRTGRNAVGALSEKELHAYSDFLLHDMGVLADGIGGDEADASGIEAVARRTEMRTAPLWGLRLVERFLHDGRAATLDEAIKAHEGQGATARAAFLGLSPEDRTSLVAFLRSL